MKLAGQRTAAATVLHISQPSPSAGHRLDDHISIPDGPPDTEPPAHRLARDSAAALQVRADGTHTVYVVDSSPPWGKTPRESIQQECDRRGKRQVVDGCIDPLGGRDAGAELILALGGPPARWVVTGEPSGPPYWLRVWAARGLLWAWDDVALPAVLAALRDEAWRVREMALKVVARHRLADALTVVSELHSDPAPRVRAAASRALRRLAADED